MMTLLKKKYSFVIFDWDGTLMDSTARIVSAMRGSANIIGLSVPTKEEVKGIIGLSMHAVLERLFPLAQEAEKKLLLAEYKYQYIEADPTPTPLFSGVIEHLNWLREQNIKLAVATGKARAGLSRVLNEVNLQDFFDYTICADEAESKPHPQMVLELIKNAQTSPNETLVIGDSVHDINMANYAKVDSVAVTSGASGYDELIALNPQAIFEQITHIKPWYES